MYIVVLNLCGPCANQIEACELYGEYSIDRTKLKLRIWKRLCISSIANMKWKEVIVSTCKKSMQVKDTWNWFDLSDLNPIASWLRVHTWV